MKNFCLLALSVFVFSSAAAQPYRVPVKELTDSFFNMHTQTKKEENFYSRLDEAARWFTSPGNKSFTKAVFSLAKEKKIGIDSAAIFIFDTVFNTYINTRMWDEFPGQPAKDSTIFRLYNTSICACVTKALAASKSFDESNRGIQKCMSTLVGDPEYSNAIRKAAENRTMDDLMAMAQHAGRYSMQYCPAWRAYFTDALKSNSVNAYAYLLTDDMRRTGRFALLYYEKKLDKQLGAYFPAWKKYELHLKKALTVSQDNEYMSNRNGMMNAQGHLSFTLTYYKIINKKPVLTGQVIYVTDEANPASPLLSFVFVAPAGIKDREKLVREIISQDLEVERPPAPPSELPPGVEMKKGN